jgi:hypothetical protein
MTGTLAFSTVCPTAWLVRSAAPLKPRFVSRVRPLAVRSFAFEPLWAELRDRDRVAVPEFRALPDRPCERLRVAPLDPLVEPALPRAREFCVRLPLVERFRVCAFVWAIPASFVQFAGLSP